MTTDPRALLAEARKQLEVLDTRRKASERAVAHDFFGTHRREILDGYERALDEVERRRANPLDCCAAHPGELASHSNATRPCAPCRINAGIAHLRTELGEAKLVIEQQDRDLERMRALIADLRTPMNEDRIDAILSQGAPCTDATKTK